MNTGIWVLIVIIALGAGLVGGFFIARATMKNYLEKNPPVNEDMLRVMMQQMGQKPSEKKIQQMVHSMNAQSKKSNKKKK